ncbi:MAG: hypothetical protein OXD36_18155 [Rhodobacter sp.]|nr:hypothetical protein [Rhodobacter sp.]
MKKHPWRKNVLYLMTVGYATTFFVFLTMVLVAGKDVGTAYDMIAPPLMALVGGSLAISKDLIKLDEDLDRAHHANNGNADNQDDQAKRGNSEE